MATERTQTQRQEQDRKKIDVYLKESLQMQEELERKNSQLTRLQKDLDKEKRKNKEV